MNANWTYRIMALWLVCGGNLYGQRSLPPPPTATSYAGVIEGQVSFSNPGSSSKRRIPETRVWAMRVRPGPWTSAIVSIDREGRFRIEGVPSGEYVLCGETPRANYADPCFWLSPSLARTFSVSPGQKAAGQVLMLAAGRRLRVTVRDPLRANGSRRADGGNNAVIFRVAGGPPGSEPRMMVSNRPEPDGLSYEVVIPAGTQPRVVSYARGVRLADEAGRELPDQAASRLVSLPAAAHLPTVLEYRILGTRN